MELCTKPSLHLSIGEDLFTLFPGPKRPATALGKRRSWVATCSNRGEQFCETAHGTDSADSCRGIATARAVSIGCPVQPSDGLTSVMQEFRAASAWDSGPANGRVPPETAIEFRLRMTAN